MSIAATSCLRESFPSGLKPETVRIACYPRHGGGLALAGAIDDNGIGAALALQSVRLEGVPPALVIALPVVVMTFPTELTRNAYPKT